MYAYVYTLEWEITYPTFGNVTNFYGGVLLTQDGRIISLQLARATTHRICTHVGGTTFYIQVQIHIVTKT